MVWVDYPECANCGNNEWVASNELKEEYKQKPLNCQLILQNGNEYTIKDANGIIKKFTVTDFKIKTL